MAGYYGVKEGKLPGVYESWEECQQQIKGYSGAVYKKFKTREDALAFVNEASPVSLYNIDGLDEDTEVIKDIKKERALKKRIEELELNLSELEERLSKLENILQVEEPINNEGEAKKLAGNDEESSGQMLMDLEEVKRDIGENELVAYVDGSYRNDTQEYSYGMVIFTANFREEYFEKYDDDLKTMRNVAGEIKGAEKAMEKAMELGKNKLYLHYDYLGIEKWAREEWKANKKGTQDYRDYYLSIKDKLDVEFIKVLAHSGDEYNELADSLAKKALGID